jgi:SAM-dependent methyltransferase
MPLKDLNDITVATYQNNFQKYKDVTPGIITGELKDWIDSFAKLLPENGKVFEIGSATGRDARYLSSLGYEVMCTDVIREALDTLSGEGFSTSPYDFRDLPREEWKGQFDGYLANAVLLHAPQHIFEQTLQYAHSILKRGGIAVIVLKSGMGQEMILDKMGAPRYFKYQNDDSLKMALAKMPFEVISVTHSEPKKWIRVLLRAV